MLIDIDGSDGLVYDIESLTAIAIREDQIYGGMRLRTEARLGNTRIPITVDLGFGDALADPSEDGRHLSRSYPRADRRTDKPGSGERGA